jgi:hypothetical protein
LRQRVLGWLGWAALLGGVITALGVLGMLIGQPSIGVCAGVITVFLIAVARYLLR